MAKGWIKLHRSLISHDIWLSEKFTKGQAWIDLLLLANGENNGSYKRGSVYRGKEWLSKRWRWDRQTVTRFLNKLEEMGMITQTTTRNAPYNATVITIVKWGFYQNDATHNATHNTTQNATQNATLKRRKEEEKTETPALPSAADALYGGYK